MSKRGSIDPRVKPKDDVKGDPRVKPKDDVERIVFIDGQYQPGLSNITELVDGISMENDVFTLRLPKNFKPERPIYLQHINKTAGSRQLKHLIIADKNSDATIVDSYEGEPETISQVEVKIDLKANARLHYYKWQREGEKAQHHAEFIAEQARHSYLGTYHVVMGANISHDRFSYQLIGEGSTCESIGFYQSQHKQKFRVDSHIHHRGSHTNSRQLYKGIAKDQSHAIFNGMIMVAPGLKEICAHQKNDNLLLSPQAQIDTRPELEIYSEDVRCSHGATVGQLDEDALFYLRSRGVDEVAARDLLMDGFTNEVFNAFPDSDLVALMRGV